MNRQEAKEYRNTGMVSTRKEKKEKEEECEMCEFCKQRSSAKATEKTTTVIDIKDGFHMALSNNMDFLNSRWKNVQPITVGGTPNRVSK